LYVILLPVSARSKLYDKVAGNPRDVRYAKFRKLMEAFGYEERCKRGSQRLFILDKKALGEAWSNLSKEVRETIEIVSMHAPHHSGDAVSTHTVKRALANIDIIRLVIGG